MRSRIAPPTRSAICSLALVLAGCTSAGQASTAGGAPGAPGNARAGAAGYGPADAGADARRDATLGAGAGATGSSTEGSADATAEATAGGADSSRAGSGCDAGAQPFVGGVSPTGRHLVDQCGAPWLFMGDSPQALMAHLLPGDVDGYFADRQARGFNAAWVNAVVDAYTAGNADGRTDDGIAPFTSPSSVTDPSQYDVTTPNEAYFQRLDHAVASAAAHGITVLLDPIETGGWLATLKANGTAKAQQYGAWIGARYAGAPNVMWLNGNDFCSNDYSPSDDPYVLAVARGIAGAAPRQLQTVEFCFNVSTSSDDATWTASGLIQLDAVYSEAPTYAETLVAYGRPGGLVPFLVESSYEGENNAQPNPATPSDLRKQEWWTLLSGAAGQFYASHESWRFDPGWQAAIDTVGAGQVTYVQAFFAPRAWWTLVPDQAHAFVTAGFGTFSSTVGDGPSNDYATAALGGDGRLGVVYVPTSRTLTVDATRLAGSALARWYDPTSGAYRMLGNVPNTGPAQLTTPGNNAAGDPDWVLVLEVQ